METASNRTGQEQLSCHDPTAHVALARVLARTTDKEDDTSQEIKRSWKQNDKKRPTMAPSRRNREAKKAIFDAQQTEIAETR